MKVVWMIQNLVPYHHARFDAFASQDGVDASLIEVTDRDDFNVLEYRPESKSYDMFTLFPGRKRASISAVQIRAKLLTLLDEIKPDCVCVSGWGMVIGQQMHYWALKHGVPVILFSESTEYDEVRLYWKEWIKSKLVRSASAALVGGAPHRAYIELLGMHKNAVFDGHNVVDITHFSSPITEFPKALPDHLKQESFFAVCTRFGEKKNLPRLVRAYGRYVEKCHSNGLSAFKLVIAGDGPTRCDVEQEIKNVQMRNRVMLLGPVDYTSLPWLYQHCRAFVHASTTEQWGLVVNEAMAAGAPVVLSKRCGCAFDLLQENLNGFGFDPYHEESIAEALLKITVLPAHRLKSFSNHSRDIINAWGPKRFAHNLLLAVNIALSESNRQSEWLARYLLLIMTRYAKIN